MTRLIRTLMMAMTAVVASLVVASPAHAASEYLIHSKANTGLCVGVNSSNNIASVWNCNSASNDQRWHQGATCDSGYCSQVNGNGKCLSVSGSSQSDGAYLTARTCSGSWDQKWKFESSTGALINFYDNCAGIKDGVVFNGASMVQWYYQAHSDQKWYRQYL